jgi:hypothetical protein
MKMQVLASRVVVTLCATWFALDSESQPDATLQSSKREVWADLASYGKPRGPSAEAPYPEADIWTVDDGFNVVFLNFQPPHTGIWEGEPGHGFKRGTQTLSLESGATAGLDIFGSRQKHDLALASLSYGYMLSSVVARDHWYRGNWELRGELFGGSEFSPHDGWVAGLTPHLRYNFATDTPWVPFIDAGAGFTGTGISRPDLNASFEFNLQAGGGVHRFLRRDLALTMEVRYLHMSCAGMSSPNLGVNGVMGMIGVTKFF